MGKVIVKTSQKEFAAGLTYTGCTRVKREEDLAVQAYNGNFFPSLQK